MRLRDYQNLLEDSINSLKQLSMTIIQNNANVGRSHDVKVFGLVAFNNTISKLEKTNLFDKIIKNIRSLEYFNRAENDIVVRQNEYDNLNNYRQQLLTQIENLKNTIDNILPEENSESINLKLPEYKTFEEYNNLFKLLKIVFAPFDLLQVTTDLNNFETGSKWINISFNKPSKEDLKTITIFILLFFNMANSSLDLRNKYLEGEKSIAYIKQYENQVSEQERKKLLEAFEILQKTDNSKYEQYKEEIIKKILINSGIKLSEEKENEIMPRIGSSLEIMGKLMDEGMEIVPALNAPDEIKTLSTNFNEKLDEHKKLMIGLSTQKLIEKKDNEEGTQDQETDKENINDK